MKTLKILSAMFMGAAAVTTLTVMAAPAAQIAANAASVVQQRFGSTIQAGEYNATSTRSFNGVALPNLVVLNAGAGICPTTCPGTFGSVIITGANTGVINFFDATTSDVNKRTGNTATSSLFIAQLPTNAAVGTYTFDISLRNGLLYEIIGTAATSTITER